MKIANDILIPELARLLDEEKEVRFTPSGVSMRPFIEGGADSVVLSPLHRDPRKGDIILARVIAPNGNKLYVLHRLVRIEKDENGEPAYILMGDGNLMGEEVCSRGDIIGRVAAIERPNGKRKPLTRGRLWYALRPLRKYLLKLYRHSVLKWNYADK
jgi:hypothetical protein